MESVNAKLGTLSLHVQSTVNIYHDYAHCPHHQIPTLLYTEYNLISLKVSWQDNQLLTQPHSLH